MSQTLDQLLERLATVADDEGQISLDGHVLRGPSGCVRFVTEGLFLDFDAHDVLNIEKRDESVGYAIPVRMLVRRGVAVHAIGSSEPLKGLIGEGRVPFAVLSREAMKRSRDNRGRKEYEIKARRFLEKYDLTQEASRNS